MNMELALSCLYWENSLLRGNCTFFRCWTHFLISLSLLLFLWLKSKNRVILLDSENTESADVQFLKYSTFKSKESTNNL